MKVACWYPWLIWGTFFFTFFLHFYSQFSHYCIVKWSVKFGSWCIFCNIAESVFPASIANIWYMYLIWLSVHPRILYNLVHAMAVMLRTSWKSSESQSTGLSLWGCGSILPFRFLFPFCRQGGAWYPYQRQMCDWCSLWGQFTGDTSTRYCHIWIGVPKIHKKSSVTGELTDDLSNTATTCA